ncbi:MAG: hypothetical protein AAGI17_10205 [Planctomycetota bacterium]
MPPVSEEITSPVVRTVRGDWEDIGAALNVALPRCRVTTLGREVEFGEPEHPADVRLAGASLPEVSRVYALLTGRGAEGELSFRRGAGVDEIVITCRVGPFGQPAVEFCLVEELALRLGDLYGVGVAPVRTRARATGRDTGRVTGRAGP